MARREEYLTKKGIRYRVRWEDPATGKTRHWRAGASAKRANDKIREIEEALFDEKPIRESYEIEHHYKKFITMRENLLLSNPPMLKESTLRIQKTALKPFLDKFKNRLLTEITSDELQAYKDDLLATNDPAGINIIVRNIKQFFNYCEQRGEFPKVNPAKILKEFNPKKIKVNRYLNRKELAHLLKSCPYSMKHLRRVAFILYNTSLRTGGFHGMKWEKLEPNGITVYEKGKWRFVRLDYQKKRKLLRKLVTKFIRNPLNRNTYNSGWRTMVKRANCGRVRPHEMRHTWATNMLAAGWPTGAVMDMGGWESTAMLDIYTHFPPNFIPGDKNDFAIKK